MISALVFPRANMHGARVRNRKRLAAGGYTVLVAVGAAVLGTASALPGAAGDVLSISRPAYGAGDRTADDEATGRLPDQNDPRAARDSFRVDPPAASSVDVSPTPAPAADGSAPAFAALVPLGTTQVVRTVRTNQWCPQKYCSRTEAWELVDGTWGIVTMATGNRAVFRSTIGPKGFAAPGKRREDDGRSPTGVYAIVTTFTTGNTAPSAMPWRKRLKTSIVSARHGKNYNTWIEDPKERGGNRASMKYGFWIDYNNPRLVPGVGPAPVPGVGSGIFYHTAHKGLEWIPTFGCTQLGRSVDMAWVLHWLDPMKNPRVVNNL